MNACEWIQYYEKHRQRHAAEVYDWGASPLPDREHSSIQALAGSLAIFQLGESGGGTRLRRYAEVLSAADPAFAGYSRAVELFIREENAHAEILKEMVRRLGGTLLAKQWSNSVFRFIRSALGLEFNVQILLSAELIARGYYGLLARQAPDPVIRDSCLRITRDEVAHIAFHVDFFRDRLAVWPAWRAALWRTQFLCLFQCARLVVWWDHGRALRGCGISRQLFQEKTGRACLSFLGSLNSRGAKWWGIKAGSGTRIEA
ncbi:MAG: ferritin-like domain-containing protein [Verrucomicrobiota bacterium]